MNKEEKQPNAVTYTNSYTRVSYRRILLHGV